MKTLLGVLALSISLFAYERGKIDMHGGKHESYTNISGYKSGEFAQALGRSMFLENNATKSAPKEKNTHKKD